MKKIIFAMMAALFVGLPALYFHMASGVNGGPAERAPMHTQTATELKHTNHLVNETSPYLLQHADNPVDWHPWGQAALDKAKAENKPIFLSIGYAACHWCHVMEHESFEDEEIAAILNEHFISIKVDREERPDVDSIYMSAVQAMTGSGGWPLNVFLTPELKPFYGGTYFPPESKYGMPSFKMVLMGLIDAWESKRSDIESNAEQLLAVMKQNLSSSPADPAASLSKETLERATEDLRRAFDPIYGGFGPAPKFPPSSSISVLMRQYAYTKDKPLLDMATLTLDKMYQGGMYDHLGGGFHRYSTDEKWLVPHFEKMLYDNALLSSAYLDAYQLTGNDEYKRVAKETLDYVLRDMTDPGGAFYSSQDADSEGEEGKFYVWEMDEVNSILGEENGKLFAEYYALRENGNFSSPEEYHGGKNILHIAKSGEKFEQLDGLKKQLLDVRYKRVAPGLDDKIITAWNALMVSAFARGYTVLQEARYLEAAEKAAAFVLENMTDDGRLLRTHRAGQSKLPAYLDDYAFMSAALLDLYEASFDEKWLMEADRLTKEMLELFWDDEAGGLFYTSDEHKNLIVRTKPGHDGAIPSGNSIAAHALLRLAILTDSKQFRQKADKILDTNLTGISRAPRGYMNMLAAVDMAVNPPKEIAIVGKTGSEELELLLKTLHKHYLPNKVIAFLDPTGANSSEVAERIPLLRAKTLVSGKAAVYVCENYACKRPVTSVEDFEDLIEIKTAP